MSESPIAGQGVTVHQLFSGYRYQLGAYQREYSWSQDAVRALLNDLHNRFSSSWREGHGRGSTQSYEPYFLGPYVYHQEDGATYLVDGQQRFTTLHLLLIYLRRLHLDQENRQDASNLERLIFTSWHGRATYTIDIEEREDLLTRLLDHESYELPVQSSPSLRTMLDRYQDIDEFFPEELRGEQLPLFCDWLLERVCLVGIRATGRDNGWEIFESMNNRGVPLGPIDLLKSHLLHHAGRTRESALNDRWRTMLSRLAELESDHPNAASKFVKTLLIAKYADLSEDSDHLAQVEKSFHEWVRAREADRMGLRRPEDFEQTIAMFIHYGEHYGTFARASHRYEAADPRLQSLYFNRHNGLDFQFPLVFAALEEADGPDVVKNKADMIGTFLDCVYVRRIVNNETSVNKLEFDTRSLIPRLRAAKTVEDVRQVLASVFYDLAPELSEIQHMTLGQNYGQVKYILARITAFVDQGCGSVDRSADYLDREKNFQIEHIWSRGSVHRNIESFEQLRNRVGLLLLLPGADNASFRDDPYEQKVEHYYAQNWLAASLHPKAYTRNPGFRKFKQAHGLGEAFRAFPEELAPADIENRQQLYHRLAEKVWDVGRFGVTCPPAPAAVSLGSSTRERKRYGVSVGDLVHAGMLDVGGWLRLTRRDETYWSEVLGDGRLRTQDGQVHSSPSGAGQRVLGNKSCDGWRHWHARRGDDWVSLKVIRQEAIDNGFLEPPGG